ncbi:MAG: hypothetical protein GY946_13565, partial [bacterium]|nr:hypothetical protein [bacterium]
FLAYGDAACESAIKTSFAALEGYLEAIATVVGKHDHPAKRKLVRTGREPVMRVVAKYASLIERLMTSCSEETGTVLQSPHLSVGYRKRLSDYRESCGKLITYAKTIQSLAGILTKHPDLSKNPDGELVLTMSLGSSKIAKLFVARLGASTEIRWTGRGEKILKAAPVGGPTRAWQDLRRISERWSHTMVNADLAVGHLQQFVVAWRYWKLAGLPTELDISSSKARLASGTVVKSRGKRIAKRDRSLKPLVKLVIRAYNASRSLARACIGVIEGETKEAQREAAEALPIAVDTLKNLWGDVQEWERK